MDTAIFGGANGWWRTDVIREIRFDRGMLTEDIDASTRSLLAGYRLVHDRTVISTELAPADWKGWWRQRTRWAQGWLQVTMRHQRAIWRSERMSWTLKAYWSVLLAWREIFPVLSLQIITLVASDLLLHGRMEIQFDPLVALSVLLTFGSGTVAAIVTYGSRPRRPVKSKEPGDTPSSASCRRCTPDAEPRRAPRARPGDARRRALGRDARRQATAAAAALAALTAVALGGPGTPERRRRTCRDPVRAGGSAAG